MSSENSAEDPTAQWVGAGIFPAGLTVPQTREQRMEVDILNELEVIVHQIPGVQVVGLQSGDVMVPKHQIRNRCK